MNLNETRTNQATSLEELQIIAENQIENKIEELEEHILALKALSQNLTGIEGEESYSRIIDEVLQFDNLTDLPAIKLLGQEIETIKAGLYF